MPNKDHLRGFLHNAQDSSSRSKWRHVVHSSKEATVNLENFWLFVLSIHPVYAACRYTNTLRLTYASIVFLFRLIPDAADASRPAAALIVFTGRPILCADSAS